MRFDGGAKDLNYADNEVSDIDFRNWKQVEQDIMKQVCVYVCEHTCRKHTDVCFPIRTVRLSAWNVDVSVVNTLSYKFFELNINKEVSMCVICMVLGIFFP